MVEARDESGRRTRLAAGPREAGSSLKVRPSVGRLAFDQGERRAWRVAFQGVRGYHDRGADLHDAPEAVHETMMCLLKTREDSARVTREVTGRILGKVA